MEKSAFRKGMEHLTWFLLVATVCFLVLYRYYAAPWVLSCTISFGTTLYHFLMRLAVGFFIPFCFKEYNYHHWWFLPRKWEETLYGKLKVRKWKRKIPTFDPTQFSLAHHTLPQIVNNMCQAEVVHETIVVFSFFPLLFSVYFGAFPVFLITSLAAALFDCVFIVAQRYNRPRLIRLMQKGANNP